MAKVIVTNENKVVISKDTTLVLKNNIVNLEYDIKDSCSVLLFNDYNGDLVLNETGKISGCTVKLNYLQLVNYNLIQNTSINVLNKGVLEVNATYLGSNKKSVSYTMANKDNETTSMITNNVVCLNEADFTLNCVGTIEKGAKRSICHQKNRCLTIDKPKNAKILPVLNIDENDVEASHSLSCGTIDEEVLFYMNSRGLNKKESLNLILKSYLMPNDSFYEDFEDGKLIQQEAIKKVDTLCLM